VKDKVAIVTGAGQGIGKEICRQIVEAGGKVVVNDLDQVLVDLTTKELGSQSIGHVGDMSNMEHVVGLINYALSEFGSVDTLVANAGITLFGDFFEFGYEDFMKIMQVNLAGTFFLTQHAAKIMKSQGSGSIVFMSSVTGNQAHKHLAAYSMSKAALQMLAKNLVIELSPFNINVNCVAPGAIVTERTLMDQNYAETWAELTPMGRAGSVSDVSNTVMFLISENARHITGQTIIVDGGWSVVSPNPKN
jgi:NAD(P)-dependent dehydrogenase (short-subunit alcohol dehydrogenase family)